MKSKLFVLILLIPIICSAKIVILEIDRGVSQSHPEIVAHINKENRLKFDYNLDSQHGNHIAGLLLKNTCKEVELQSCYYYDNFYNCLKLAIKTKPDLINISSGGYGYDKVEYELLKQLSMPIIVAAGNDGRNLLFPGNEYFPACYNLKNIVPVGNLDPDGQINTKSNYGLPNEVWEYGTKYSTFPHGQYGIMQGTSQSTAVYSNRLLLQKCAEIHK